jgi:hypothetical protein
MKKIDEQNSRDFMDKFEEVLEKMSEMQEEQLNALIDMEKKKNMHL